MPGGTPSSKPTRGQAIGLALLAIAVAERAWWQQRARVGSSVYRVQRYTARRFDQPGSVIAELGVRMLARSSR
jgi:hypothetical protein